MVAPIVASEIVTLCTLVYVPDASEKVGFAVMVCVTGKIVTVPAT